MIIMTTTVMVGLVLVLVLRMMVTVTVTSPRGMEGHGVGTRMVVSGICRGAVAVVDLLRFTRLPCHVVH